MSKEKNLPEFRLLLANAISTRTQSEFASVAGIAPAMLNRMLNQEEISTPSKKTLRKIAVAAQNFDELSSSVTYDALLKACGYPSTTTLSMRPENFEVFISETVMGCKGKIFDSLDAMAKAALPEHSETISYAISRKAIHPEDETKAEYAAIIRFSTKINKTLAMSDVLVLYFQTVTGKVVVSDITNDVKRAATYGGETAQKLIELRYQASQDGTPSTSSILYLRNRQYEPPSTEVRLLNAIFGTGENTVSERIFGIGFYLSKDMPEYVFKNFLKAHKKTFCQNALDREIYQSYVEEGVSLRFEAFGSYNVDTNTGAGGNTWLGAIVNIIFRETGLNMQGWLNAKYLNKEPCADCIVFPANMPWAFTEAELLIKSEQELVLLLDKYAFELRAEVTVCDFIGKHQK